MDDLPSDKKPLDRDILLKVKSFVSARNRVMIYCSALGSPSPSTLYCGRSMITYKDTIVEQSELSIYEPSEVMYAEVDLDGVKESVVYGEMEVEELEVSCVDCNYCFRSEARAKSRPKKPIRQLERIVLRESTKYFLWYVFKKYNKWTPFHISSLLSLHNLTLIHLLDKLAT